PEYGATCGFFPITAETIRYLSATGRNPDRIALVEAYAKEQGMWRDASTPEPIFTDTLDLDLSTVQPSLAGPKRPQDRVLLKDAPSSYANALEKEYGQPGQLSRRVIVKGEKFDVGNGDVVIAAITSC